MGPPGGNVMLRLLFRRLKSHRSDSTDEVIINLLVYFFVFLSLHFSSGLLLNLRTCSLFKGSFFSSSSSL
jgi:hypothetical protein